MNVVERIEEVTLNRKLAIQVNPDSQIENQAKTSPKREFRSDEEFRRAVIDYEISQGRHPDPKPSNQEGYDIESYDGPPEIVDRKLLRRIEVKGKGVKWASDEIVTMSLPQFSPALRHEPGTAGWDYWLYVVERTDEGQLKVLPIRNPAKRSAGFDLRGGTWRWAVEGNATPQDD